MASVSMVPGTWDVVYGEWPNGQTSFQHPKSNPNAAGWEITFPQDGGGLGTLTHVFDRPTDLWAHTGIKVTGWSSIQSGGSFFALDNPDNFSPRVKVFVQRWGDNWTGTGKYEFYRWYSRAFYELGNSVWNSTVPIDLNEWSSVMGKGGTYNDDVRRAMVEAFKNVERVGFVFGASYAAHWVRTRNSRGKFGCSVCDPRGAR